MSIFNLLPDDYFRRRREQRTLFFCLILFGVIMVYVVLQVTSMRQSCDRVQARMDQVDQDYQAAAAPMSKLQAMEAQRQQLVAKAKATSHLQERIPRSYLLAMVTNSLPQGASLESFDLYPKKVIVPKAAPSKSRDRKFASKSKATKGKDDNVSVMEMELTGLAPTDVDVARFITNLSQSPLAASVDLVFSQEKAIEIKDAHNKVLSKPVLREFQVRVVLKNDIDVADVAGTTAQGTAAAAKTGAAS